MKSVKWMVAFGACSIFLFAGSASAASRMHAKPLAAASAKKMHTAAKADRKAQGQKRAPHHDPQLDYPQLG
jgi:hypothetical protein